MDADRHCYLAKRGQGICFAFPPDLIALVLKGDPRATEEFFTEIYRILDAFRPQFRKFNPLWSEAYADELCGKFVERLLSALQTESSKIENLNAWCSLLLTCCIKDEYRRMTAGRRDCGRNLEADGETSDGQGNFCTYFELILADALPTPLRPDGRSPLRVEASAYELYKSVAEPWERLDREDRRKLAEWFLSTVESARDREILALWMRGLSMKAISAKTGMKEGSVGCVISRALEKLRERAKKRKLGRDFAF